MYLADQCLTLGRRKIVPFIESLGLEENGSRIAASLSTLHLVNPLRASAMSALLDQVRAQKSKIQENFNISRGLRVCPHNIKVDHFIIIFLYRIVLETGVKSAKDPFWPVSPTFLLCSNPSTPFLLQYTSVSLVCEPTYIPSK